MSPTASATTATTAQATRERPESESAAAVVSPKTELLRTMDTLWRWYEYIYTKVERALPRASGPGSW